MRCDGTMAGAVAFYAAGKCVELDGSTGTYTVAASKQRVIFSEQLRRRFWRPATG